MKTNFKRIGKQSISIVLAVMMMLSTMLVGMVTSNAVEIKANTVFYLDISNATKYFSDPNNIYMSVVGSVNKDLSPDAAIKEQQYKPQKDTWYQMEQTENSNIYKVTVTDSSSIGKVSFWNKKIDNYNNISGVSCALCKTYDGEKNLFTLSNESVYYTDNGVNSRSFDGTWSTYGTEPTTKYDVIVDPNITNGKVETSATSLAAGETFTVTATPNPGYVLGAITVTYADGKTVEAIDASKHTYKMPANNVTVSATFAEKSKTKYAVVGYLQNLDTKSTEPTHLYANGIKFVDGVAVIDVDADNDRNWFAIADDNGNYYSCPNANVVGYTSETNTKELTQGTTKPDGKAVPWIGTTGVYRLHLVEGSDSTKLNIWVESVTNPWRIYGTTDYFKNWTLASTGDPIALSYKGNANQYYYPVEVTDITKKIYFGLYFNNSKHQPSTGETNTVLTENNKISGIDQWTVQDSQISFEIDPDTTGTYYICVDTATNSVWYEKAQTQPVSVELNATPVGDSAAYISSYTNETGETVTNTDKTVKSVNAKPGTPVTFQATSVEGYFPKWRFGGKSATGDTYILDASSVTGTTVTVFLTYEEIKNHNLTITSGEGGSVSYTNNETTDTVETGATSPAIHVASNKTITLTANAVNDYVFSGWKFDDESNVVFATGQNSFSPSITINVVGDVKVTATFEKRQGTHSDWKFMLSDSDEKLSKDSIGTYTTPYPVYQKPDGTYSVTFPVSAISSNTTQYFTFSKTGDNTGFEPGDVGLNVKIADNFKQYVKEADKKEWGQKYVVLATFQNTDDIDTINVTYNPNTKTYTIDGSCYVLPGNSHKVYATMGSQAGHKFGTTTISLLSGDKPLKTNVKDFYNLYFVNDKEQITVSCSVSKDQADLGYYVYAFVVNGKKVDVVDNGNNVYQTASPITVTEDLEITPIYYNKVIEAEGNYITIYTNAPESLQTPWGNSISIYSWYGKDSNNKMIEMDGAYPGQLMMRDSQGRFVAKVAKYAYTNDNGKFTCDKSHRVLGITNNNYYENEDVHKLFLSEDQSCNNQTYDYDDFEKLTAMGYDTVEFDVKYYADKTESNQELLVGNATENKSMKGSTIIREPATDYEDLTNIDGKLVSILGYTDETAQKNNNTGLNTAYPLQIISVGNQSMRIGTTNNQWSTIWYVYNSAGDYVTQGMPSDFIPRGSVDEDGNFSEGKPTEQTAAYQAIVNAGLKYNSAKISYEIRMGAATSVDTKNTGQRIDGRWYYARSVDQVDVNVGIIYKNNAGKWTVDTPTETSKITGMVTGGSASFDYTDSKGSPHTNLASATVDRNTVITVNATNGTQYKFIGWGTPTYDADGRVTDYTPINLTDLNATYTVSTNTKLFAMYEPYATGSVTITHSKYTGSDSHNGFGIFSVTAQVVDANGKPVASQAVATQSDAGSVTLENIVNKNDYFIEVTLHTQSYAKSHFLYFYYPSVSNGAYTLEKDPKGDYYDKECTVSNLATKTFTVKVSDLFVNGKQTVMALNYYSDLKLPEVESNITFNYSPYSTAPSPNTPAGKGTGKTTFTLTITKNDGEVVYTSKSDISSLTLKGNEDLKDILENLASGSDYTITITMNPVPDSHCEVGETYRQTNNDGTYIYTEASSDNEWAYNKDNNTYSASLSDLFDITTQKFKTNTINLYTDFTAKEFSYNVKFMYLGYESREYYNTNGFTQYEIPKDNIQDKWWKTYTVNGTFCGADIDTYYDSDTKTFKEPFLLKVAPYEDNFVQSITWDLENAACSESNDGLSVEATVFAKYKNDSVTVTADFGDGEQKQTHTVNYASLVTSKNLVGSTTQSANDEEYLFVAPEIKDGKKFSYWTIQTDDSNGIEVAKCYSKEFNFIAYDNYLITACYGKDDVDESKKSVSATMQFLEYSRNKYDGKDRVYADFAVAYNYNHLLLQESNNPNIVCGVAFVLNSKYKSPGNAVDTFNVNPADLYEKVKALNENSATDKNLTDGSKVFNYVINKSSLDNKNRIEYNWSVDNLSTNQQLTLLAYSYIYDKSNNVLYSVSDPQSFKFYEVGNKSYVTQE